MTATCLPPPMRYRSLPPWRRVPPCACGMAATDRAGCCGRFLCGDCNHAHAMERLDAVGEYGCTPADSPQGLRLSWRWWFAERFGGIGPDLQLRRPDRLTFCSIEQAQLALAQVAIAQVRRSGMVSQAKLGVRSNKIGLRLA